PAFGAVEGVEAFPVAAEVAGPVLEHDAVAEDELNAARADRIARAAVLHVPLADPEVQLARARVAGAGLLVLRRLRDGGREARIALDRGEVLLRFERLRLPVALRHQRVERLERVIHVVARGVGAGEVVPGERGSEAERRRVAVRVDRAIGMPRL